MKIEWKKRAQREFFRAYSAIYDANPDAAKRWSAHVSAKIRMLDEHPAMGRRLRLDRDGDFREVTVGRYRLIYRLTPDVLEVRRLLHVRRDYDPQTIREGFPSGPRAFVTV